MDINMFEMKVKYPHRQLSINCAGSSFRPKEHFTNGIRPGDKVNFVPEPDNPYREKDENGNDSPYLVPMKMVATTQDGRELHIGYIKKDWLKHYHTTIQKYNVELYGIVSLVFDGSNGEKNCGARVDLMVG